MRWRIVLSDRCCTKSITHMQVARLNVWCVKPELYVTSCRESIILSAANLHILQPLGRHRRTPILGCQRVRSFATLQDPKPWSVLNATCNHMQPPFIFSQRPFVQPDSGMSVDVLTMAHLILPFQQYVAGTWAFSRAKTCFLIYKCLCQVYTGWLKWLKFRPGCSIVCMVF